MFTHNDLHLRNLNAEQSLYIFLVYLHVGVDRVPAPVGNHTVRAVLVGRDPENKEDDERSHGGDDKVACRDEQNSKEQNGAEIGPL